MAPPWSSGTQVKFLAVYPLPWDLETSAIFQNSPGIPITASYVITNAQVRDALGRNLAACPSQTVATCTQTVRTELIPPNTVFEPRLTQVDLRVSRLFRLGATTRLRGHARYLQRLQCEQRAQHDADLRGGVAERRSCSRAHGC